MSLCYDGEKLLMMTLSIVAISLIVSLFILLGEAYGYTDSQGYELPPELQNAVEECIKESNSTYAEIICQSSMQSMFKALVEQFCERYKDQGRNPIHDLVDNGILNPKYRNMSCEEVK